MQSLKEVIAADLDIFVELEEFAQVIELDGVKLPAQKITHTEEKSARLTEQYDGLHGDFITIYFRREDYPKKLPVQGQWVVVDSRRYDVVSSQEELGMAKLICAAYRQPLKK